MLTLLSFLTVVLQIIPSFIVGTRTGFRGFLVQAQTAVDMSNIGGFVNPGPDEPYQLSSCTPPTVRMHDGFYCESIN